jgi:hypothetical protein
LPSKPTKWDVKVWCLADAKTKWVWAFATKWWHQILFFLLDTSVTNGWLLHRKISKKLGATPLEHYEFLLLMGKTLVRAYGENLGSHQGEYSSRLVKICSFYHSHSDT